MNMNNNLNQKQTNMAGMAKLPLIILLGLVIGAGYFLLQGDVKIPFFNDDNTVEVRRLDDYPAKIALSEELEKTQTVIKSEEELVNFLASVDPTGALTLDEKINFDREYLIGTTSKTFTTGGYEFKTRKVYEDKEKNELTVSSVIRKPADDCIVTQELNMFVDIVAISKTDKAVNFETVTETYTCSDE